MEVVKWFAVLMVVVVGWSWLDYNLKINDKLWDGLLYLVRAAMRHRGDPRYDYQGRRFRT